jgi:hypothetical protein
VTAERMAQSKDRYKMEEKFHDFLLPLVNSWAQVESQFFSVKAV